MYLAGLASTQPECTPSGCSKQAARVPPLACSARFVTAAGGISHEKFHITDCCHPDEKSSALTSSITDGPMPKAGPSTSRTVRCPERVPLRMLFILEAQGIALNMLCTEKQQPAGKRAHSRARRSLPVCSRRRAFIPAAVLSLRLAEITYSAKRDIQNNVKLSNLQQCQMPQMTNAR